MSRIERVQTYRGKAYRGVCADALREREAASAGGRPIYSLLARLRRLWRQQRERRELLDYLASDYRAAADIGMTNAQARALAGRPFWRL